jgi:hypothetical protein
VLRKGAPLRRRQWLQLRQQRRQAELMRGVAKENVLVCNEDQSNKKNLVPKKRANNRARKLKLRAVPESRAARKQHANVALK